MTQAMPNTNTDETVMMRQRILVALDHSATNTTVFQKATELAQALRGRLMLCHCLTDITPAPATMMETASIGVYGSPYTHDLIERSQALRKEKRQETMSWLHGLQAQLSDLDLTVEFDTQIGESGHYICQLAQSWQADLIVVGRRGRSGLSEILMGSVSNYVVHHAPCSVLVVQ